MPWDVLSAGARECPSWWDQALPMPRKTTTRITSKTRTITWTPQRSFPTLLQCERQSHSPVADVLVFVRVVIHTNLLAWQMASASHQKLTTAV